YTHGAVSQAHEQALSAESTAEAREQLAIVEQAFCRMPTIRFEAFVLHVFNGLTFDEVGRQMAISGRMAKKHVASALQCFQHCLESANAPRSSRQRLKTAGSAVLLTRGSDRALDRATEYTGIESQNRNYNKTGDPHES